jgi:DNA recombination protein RmuC
MTDILLILILVLCLAVLLIVVFRKAPMPQDLLNSPTVMKEGIERLEKQSREEFHRNRDENSQSAKTAREEMNALMLANRKELKASLDVFEQTFKISTDTLTNNQHKRFEELFKRQDEMQKSTELRLEAIRGVVDQKLKDLQEDNSLKLEAMRKTVDEKLHETLEKRLGESFEIVTKQLIEVQKGLGEMQTLATGVGDLKKVLSNVKTRGMLGEIQLGNILEQILAPEQYEADVRTKKGSANQVEFAIKLPGKEDHMDNVYLPIDAKFPQEDYTRLQTAYDLGDTQMIETANKALVQAIKKFAKDIRDKYLDPPNTTDFGIMFLPVEGLYAEIVRQPKVIEQLQREYKIIVTGPTTLAAILNSLQMGFRTLAIQKRSSEVWQVLGAVKTEFAKFGDVLEKAQKKITEANKELDNLVGVRSRQINRKLRQIQELPSQSSTTLLDDTSSVPDLEDEEEAE